MTSASQPVRKADEFPTNEMLDAGVREMRASTHPDRGLALDVWKAMQAARPLPAIVGEDAAREVLAQHVPQREAALIREGYSLVSVDAGPAIRAMLAFAQAHLAQGRGVEGWQPIGEAKPRHRYMGAFITPLSDVWNIVGPGSVREGVFRDNLGDYPAVSKVFHLPPVPASTARESQTQEKNDG